MGLKNWETSERHFWRINDVSVKEAARAVASQGVETLVKFCSDYVWAALGFDSIDDVPAGPGVEFVNNSLREVDYRELRNALLDIEE